MELALWKPSNPELSIFLLYLLQLTFLHSTRKKLLYLGLSRRLIMTSSCSKSRMMFVILTWMDQY